MQIPCALWAKYTTIIQETNTYFHSKCIDYYEEIKYLNYLSSKIKIINEIDTFKRQHKLHLVGMRLYSLDELFSC